MTNDFLAESDSLGTKLPRLSEGWKVCMEDYVLVT